MTSIAVIPNGNGVSTSLVLGSSNSVLADLVGKFSPGGGVPDLSASMVEVHACGGKVRDYIVRVNNSVEGSFREKSHNMISECLVACSWRPKVVKL